MNLSSVRIKCQSYAYSLELNSEDHKKLPTNKVLRTLQLVSKIYYIFLLLCTFTAVFEYDHDTFTCTISKKFHFAPDCTFPPYPLHMFLYTIRIVDFSTVIPHDYFLASTSIFSVRYELNYRSFDYRVHFIFMKISRLHQVNNFR